MKSINEDAMKNSHDEYRQAYEWNFFFFSNKRDDALWKRVYYEPLCTAQKS